MITNRNAVSLASVSHPRALPGFEVHVVGEPAVAVRHIQKRVPGDGVRERFRHGAQFVGFETPAFDLTQYVTHELPHQTRD